MPSRRSWLGAGLESTGFSGRVVPPARCSTSSQPSETRCCASAEPGRSRTASGLWSRLPRVSRLVIVLTAMERQEGHPSYPSQSLYPAKGTTVGGREDDPRRQHTDDAPACHAARPRAEQRHAGLPGGGHLAHPVLSLAETIRAVRSGWAASATAAGAARPAAADRGPHSAFDPERGAGVANLGLWPSDSPPRARARPPCRAEHSATDSALRRA